MSKQLKGGSGNTKEQIITMLSSFVQYNRLDYCEQVYEILQAHFKVDVKQIVNDAFDAGREWEEKSPKMGHGERLDMPPNKQQYIDQTLGK